MFCGDGVGCFVWCGCVLTFTHITTTKQQNLYTLGALDEEGLLTRLGRKMAEFPLEPQVRVMGLWVSGCGVFVWWCLGCGGLCVGVWMGEANRIEGLMYLYNHPHK